MTTKRRKRHSPEEIVADQALDIPMLKHLNEGNWRARLESAPAVSVLQDKFTVSERGACQVIDQPRSSHRYRAQPRDDEPALVKRMLERARERPRFGYRRIAALLRRENWNASPGRVYRLWRKEGRKVLHRVRERRASGTSDNACDRRRAEHRDDVWCWDFVFDRTTSGGTLKWLSIVDEHTRECLVLKVDRNITSEDVIDTLAELFAARGRAAADSQRRCPRSSSLTRSEVGCGKWMR